MAQENIERLWNILQSLSKDARNAAKKKCEEKEFDSNKGIVGLEESLINLANFRNVLKDAIEKKKLIKFPYSFQLDLEKKLQSISKLLTDLSEGVDTVEQLVLEIDQTYYEIWRSGLEVMSDEVLGYQEKLNQIKTMEGELDELMTSLGEGLALKNKLEGLKDSFEKNEASSTKTLEEMKENSKKTEEISATVLKKSQEVNAQQLTVNGIVTALESIQKNAKADEIIIGTLTKAIQDFHSTIEDNRVKVEGVRTSADAIVKKAQADTASLITKIENDAVAIFVKLDADVKNVTDNVTKRANEVLDNTQLKNNEIIANLEGRESQITDQMAKVTGITLFGSFGKRMEDVIKSKNVWMSGVFWTLSLIAALTLYIALSFGALDAGFYLKLSVYLPLLISIVFCTQNYSHERQLEEEYAFKSSISISLVPYKDLVQGATELKEKYADFLIRSIDNVFASPTDKVFGGAQDLSDKVDKNVKRFIELSRKISEIAKNSNLGVEIKAKGIETKIEAGADD